MGGGFKRCTPPWTRQWVDGPDLGGVLTRGDFRVQGAWGFSGQVGFGMGMASGGVGCLGHVDRWVVLVEGGDRWPWWAIQTNGVICSLVRLRLPAWSLCSLGEESRWPAGRLFVLITVTSFRWKGRIDCSLTQSGDRVWEDQRDQMLTYLGIWYSETKPLQCPCLTGTCTAHDLLRLLPTVGLHHSSQGWHK